MYRIYYQEKGLTYDEEELVKVCVICGEVYKPKKQKNKTWATVLAVAAMIVVVIAFAMNNNQQSDLVPTENPTIGVYQETAQAQQADLPPQTQAHEPTPTPEQPQETSEPVQESTHEPTPTLSPEPTQEHPAMSSPTPTPIETIQVANVVGMSQSSARSTLQNQGFTVSAHENFNNTVASGVVISQYPSAGTMLSGGSEISLTISKGREPAGSIIIQYNANGGSGAPASHSVMKTFDGDTIYLTLSSVIPNRQGYTFLYWLFENDANYGAFWPGNEISFTLSPGSVTGEQTSVLYAQWEAEPTPTPIETIQVANVVGWSQNDAKNTLQNQGFSVSINEEFSGTVASGNIISQSPSAGSSHAVSSTVTITVSRGQETVQVANVVGWSQNDARSTLHNQGFSVTVNEEFSSTVASGNVISQSPSAGSSHAVGSTVTITVSRGQDSVRVDNVVGMWMIDAERSITNQGFVVSWSYAYSDTVEFGRIISQSPAADASITRGSTINLIASQGRQPAPTPVITLTVIVNYDANGGSGAPASHGAITIEREDNSASGLHDWYSFSFILSTTIPTREGYTFQWWSIDGGIYNPGATMRFGTSEGGLGPRTVSFTYRAVWRNNATGTLIR
jgi:beta-lactam-binding protein with PASTA domain